MHEIIQRIVENPEINNLINPKDNVDATVFNTNPIVHGSFNLHRRFLCCKVCMAVIASASGEVDTQQTTAIWRQSLVVGSRQCMSQLMRFCLPKWVYFKH